MKTDFKIGDHVFLSKDTARAWGHDEKFVQRYGNRVYTVTRVGSAETMRSIYAHCVLDGVPDLLLPANELNEVNEYNFNRGNAVKYITRAGLKDKGKEAEDLEKAKWYVDRELKRVKKEKNHEA